MQRKLNKELLSLEAQQGTDNSSASASYEEEIPHFRTKNLANIEKWREGVRLDNRGQHYGLLGGRRGRSDKMTYREK